MAPTDPPLPADDLLAPYTRSLQVLIDAREQLSSAQVFGAEAGAVTTAQAAVADAEQGLARAGDEVASAILALVGEMRADRDQARAAAAQAATSARTSRLVALISAAAAVASVIVAIVAL